MVIALFTTAISRIAIATLWLAIRIKGLARDSILLTMAIKGFARITLV